MKAQDITNNNNGQGSTKADRAFTDQKQKQQQTGISNGGAQRSDQTSSRDGAHQPQRKK
ncbi:hypothetical protein [Mucilaginibacter terrenus]|uniref:hypothetical protein n=1 Tax=Mucilaginibacter terrenus TaxID=2482727 RepID=UPI0014030D1A|nr:hypothetical protein [Mucilaginibacter terrenus]